MSKTRIIMLSLLACVVVSGCNTVKGAGRDIESVGNKAEEVIN
ncbi:entericidin A/B family lipoprotein [Sphingopyxis yananensis]|nr:entericidin A/B family lipoprotein [Sphingopyxis yananensis]MCC2603531.1 entericidin A/B family lipoprotein [Sphingopyxis yananensis]